MKSEEIADGILEHWESAAEGQQEIILDGLTMAVHSIVEKLKKRHRDEPLLRLPPRPSHPDHLSLN